MIDFGTKYAKGTPTKYHGNHPVSRGEIHIHQENNFIVNNAVDEILINEAQKVSAVREAPEFLDSDYDDNGLYQVDKMRLEETKEKIKLRKREFEYKQKNAHEIENRNDTTRIHDKEVNKIAKLNLQHDIINRSKRAKKITITILFYMDV